MCLLGISTEARGSRSWQADVLASWHPSLQTDESICRLMSQFHDQSICRLMSQCHDPA